MFCSCQFRLSQYTGFSVNMRTSARLLLIAALCWALILIWGSLTDHPPQPPEALNSDKLLHLLAYLVLTLLLGGGLKIRFSPRAAWLSASLIAIILGGVIEVLQPMLSSSRVTEFAALLANGGGATLGCLLGLGRYHLFSRGKP